MSTFSQPEFMMQKLKKYLLRVCLFHAFIENLERKGIIVANMVAFVKNGGWFSRTHEDRIIMDQGLQMNVQ